MDAGQSKPREFKQNGEDSLVGGLGGTLFDNPDFFAHVVLETKPASPQEAAPPPETPLANERQRLLRQASQIAQQLRKREQELDRRESTIEAAAATFAAEQRAWRLATQEQARQQQVDQETRSIEQTKLQVRANEIAAWESAVNHEIQTGQSVLAQRELKLEERENALEQQLRALQHERHQLAQQQQELGQSLRNERTALENATRQLEERRGELQHRAEQLELKATGLQKLHSQLARFFGDQDALWADHLSSSRASVPPATPSIPKPADSSLADQASRVHDHGAEVSRLLDEVQTMLMGSLEDRLITARLHAELCEEHSPDEIEGLTEQLRARWQHALNLSEETLRRYRAEVEELLSRIHSRLGELSQEEQNVLGALRDRIACLKQTWLQLDPAQPLRGPHFSPANPSSPKRTAGATGRVPLS